MQISEQIQAHVLKRFQIIQKLGKGAYGIVWKAIERKTKTIVALKKVFQAFQNAIDAQRTFREVMYLQQLAHDNIIRLLHVIKAENNKDLYMVMDFVESDLHVVIRSGILADAHRKFIVYQICRALKYLHSAEVIHRDLKPSNILIDQNCHIKLGDFGLARSLMAKDQSKPTILTEYVATRWYRAPEILLGSNDYGKQVDMWSLGCIFGQMLTGKAMFQGNSSLNQLQKVLQVTGMPTPQDLQQFRHSVASTILKNVINTSKKKSFSSLFPNATQEALDFIKSLLKLRPSQRMTAQQALQHKYLAEFHNPAKEPVRQSPITISIDDNSKFSIKQYRDGLYNDIMKRRADIHKKWRQRHMKQLGIQVENQVLQQSQGKISSEPKGQESMSHPKSAVLEQRPSREQSLKQTSQKRLLPEEGEPRMSSRCSVDSRQRQGRSQMNKKMVEQLQQQISKLKMRQRTTKMQLMKKGKRV